MRKQYLYVSTLLLVLLSIGKAFSQADTPVIAVLEDSQKSRTETRMVVHALFAKADTGWVALTYKYLFDRAGIEPNTKWTITYDDRKLGKIAVPGPWPSLGNVWYFARDMILDVPPDLDLPLIRNTEGAFSGWNKTPEYRPLVFVNKHNVADPEGWTHIAIAPNSSLRQSLYPAFKATVDSVYHCPDTWEEVELFDYKRTDLVVVARYRNNAGQQLIALRLDKTNYGCDGVVGSDWAVHWFLLGDEPVLIGRALEFVDAGDFDGDGRSEVLFWHSAYNEDGYTLFFDGFTRRVDYWWRYH